MFYKVIPSHLIIVGDDGNRTRVSVADSPVVMPSLSTFHPHVFYPLRKIEPFGRYDVMDIVVKFDIPRHTIK